MHATRPKRKMSGCSFADLLELHLKSFSWNPIVPQLPAALPGNTEERSALRRADNANVESA